MTYMKKGDLKPDLQVTCTSNNSGVDLTTATTVQFVCRKEGATSVFFTRNATSVSAQGVATYAWQAGDTDTVGRLLFEVVATWTGSKPQHYPPESSLPVDITPSLS
jgi:hypothetical protein